MGNRTTGRAKATHGRKTRTPAEVENEWTSPSTGTGLTSASTTSRLHASISLRLLSDSSLTASSTTCSKSWPCGVSDTSVKDTCAAPLPDQTGRRKGGVRCPGIRSVSEASTHLARPRFDALPYMMEGDGWTLGTGHQICPRACSSSPGRHSKRLGSNLRRVLVW